MISLGTNITSATEELQRIDLRQLYELEALPDVQLASFVRQLRIVRSVDSKQYSLLKRRLPYAVCGIFNPSQRRTDCFAYTEYFCLDIDHVADKQMDVENLRRKLKADSRVALSFVSSARRYVGRVERVGGADDRGLSAGKLEQENAMQTSTSAVA